jgi:hypothetical protein
MKNNETPPFLPVSDNEVAKYEFVFGVKGVRRLGPSIHFVVNEVYSPPRPPGEVVRLEDLKRENKEPNDNSGISSVAA